MSFIQRLRAASSAFFRSPSVRSPKAPMRGYYAAGVAGQTSWGVLGAKRGARTLRRFSEKNVWVRVAINRRRQAISEAKWTLVRIDDEKAKPDAGVVNAVNELFTRINDKGESFATILGELVEDILVLDAGVCEIEKKAGGGIAALWSVPGEEIAPDPKWDGSQPKMVRYHQFRDGKLIASYKNDEMIYMMANPRSCSVVGLSPLEVLMDTVEADLYGEDFEFGRMKETAPSGILYLGGGWPSEKVDAFRDQWEQDIAGSRDVAIIGGGGYDPESGTTSQPPAFIPFSRSARDEMRREYMRWLATKVAAAFQMDLLAFNLSEAIHKSVGTNLQAKTDEGLISLASVIEAYVTREILWVLDPLHRHKFSFVDITPRDAKQEAEIDKLYMEIGCTTPNEVRARQGKDPVPWGDEPWPLTTAKANDPAQAGEPEPGGDDPPPDPKDDDENDD